MIEVLEHWVIFSRLILNKEELFYASNPLYIHILSDFNGIGTPGGNHFRTWPNKPAFDCLFMFKFSITKEPTKRFKVLRTQCFGSFYNDIIIGCIGKEEDHIVDIDL